MRKTKELVVTAEGRDQGKHFLLTEMSASKAEDWAIKALLALAKAGVDLPEGASGAGLAGVAVAGLQSLGGLKHEDLKPLLDEMFGCITYMPDPSRPEIKRCPPLDMDIEEVATRLQLRAEVFTLHTGFSLAGQNSTSTPAQAQRPARHPSSSTPKTSRASSRP